MSPDREWPHSAQSPATASLSGLVTKAEMIWLILRSSLSSSSISMEAGMVGTPSSPSPTPGSTGTPSSSTSTVCSVTFAAGTLF